MKWFTVTVELKDGTEKVVACDGDSALHAKNRVRNRLPVQYVKNSRPYNAEIDAKVEKVNDLPRKK